MKQNNFIVIVTLGPSLFNNCCLNEINQYGQCFYRINGSHINSEEEVESYVKFVREKTKNSKIILDLPGNKIRTKNLSEPITLIKNQEVIIKSCQLTYPDFFKHIKPGYILYANDSLFKFAVIESTQDEIRLISYNDGILLSNKGVHCQGIHDNLPFLFEKDLKLIESAIKFNIDFISASFVRDHQDVLEVKKILKYKQSPIKLIAKIETKKAVKNIKSILKEVDIINIDRGDLSSEIKLTDLDFVQKKVIEICLKKRKKVFLATQFLKYMENHPIPLIAEITSLNTTFSLGVTGIQLSEETAVGSYPESCVKLIFEMYKKFLINCQNRKGR